LTTTIIGIVYFRDKSRIKFVCDERALFFDILTPSRKADKALRFLFISLRLGVPRPPCKQGVAGGFAWGNFCPVLIYPQFFRCPVIYGPFIDILDDVMYKPCFYQIFGERKT
jgi:hypothetical protein